MQRGEGKG